MCKFFVKGICDKGNNCNFRHEQNSKTNGKLRFVKIMNLVIANLVKMNVYLHTE